MYFKTLEKILVLTDDVLQVAPLSQNSTVQYFRSLFSWCLCHLSHTYFLPLITFLFYAYFIFACP